MGSSIQKPPCPTSTKLEYCSYYGGNDRYFHFLVIDSFSTGCYDFYALKKMTLSYMDTIEYYLPVREVNLMASCEIKGGSTDWGEVDDATIISFSFYNRDSLKTLTEIEKVTFRISNGIIEYDY